MEKVEAFLKAAAKQGYELSGSVFKVDYNGKQYTVGFWVRPTRWNQALDRYELPGLVGKAKDINFDVAVAKAAKNAVDFEQANMNG